MITDTHTHLYLPEFDNDRRDVMNRADEAGVGMMILPNVDLSTIPQMRSMHSEYPEVTRMAMGLHPTEIGDNAKEDMAAVDAELRDHIQEYVAIGEIGMDLYWDKSFRDRQMEIFDFQCGRAVELGLPVIIHCREALDEVVEVISGHRYLQGVMHSFGGTPADVDRLRNFADFYFGINGIATFKNSRLADTIREITADRILLETDAPYLAPVPYRGKRNESAYIVRTAQFVADTLALPFDRLASITTDNASQLFHLQ